MTSVMQLTQLNGHTELDKNGKIVLKFDVETQGGLGNEKRNTFAR